MTEKELSIYNLLLKVLEKSIKQMKAAELLGISDRHMRRLRKAYREQGLEGLISKRRGKPSNSRIKDKVRELIQMDGSFHAWFEDKAPKYCLLGFIDDATSKIMHLKFVPTESTTTYLIALKEYLQKHGRPQIF